MRWCGWLLLAALAGCGGQMEDSPYAQYRLGRIHPQAPPETEQLGQLVGVWRAEQSTRNRDGTWPEQTTTADWIWFYILDGHAIQDDWISPPLDDATATHRTRGTNIRIFDPSEGKWKMAWIDNNTRRLATFEATAEDGKVVMVGHDNQGQLARNTFHNITHDSFDWLKEWSSDDGQTWTAVARIHCERKR